METIKRGVGRPPGGGKNPVGHTDGTYTRWVAMRQRCYNPNSHIWRYYGGRGIKVCDRWLGEFGFRNFYADIGPCNGLTLDRINNDGNYEPGNCRWISMSEQSKTRRSTKGQVRKQDCLRQKCIKAGLPYLLVYFRIKRGGWSEERALNTPIQPRGRKSGYSPKFSKNPKWIWMPQIA
jgi:hypothetical protein